LDTQYNGTLSGFLRDPITNPIEGTIVSVHFHEEYRESLVILLITLNSALQETVPVPPFQCTLIVSYPQISILKIIIYDLACNSAEQSVILSKTRIYFGQNNPILRSFFKKITFYLIFSQIFK
jgi:hypothetical protein